MLVIRRNASLTGVVQATGDLSTPVESFDSGRAEGAETHCRDVDDRTRPKPMRPASVGAHFFLTLDPVTGVIVWIAHNRLVEGKG